MWLVILGLFFFAVAMNVSAFGSKSEEPLKYLSIVLWIVSCVTAYYAVRALSARSIPENKAVNEFVLGALPLIGVGIISSIGALLAVFFGEIEGTKKLNWSYCALLVFLIIQMLVAAFVNAKIPPLM
jgi:hypothetical protein